MLAGSTTLADVYVWFTYLHSSSAKDSEDSSVTYSAGTIFGLPSFIVVSRSRHALEDVQIQNWLLPEGWKWRNLQHIINNCRWDISIHFKSNLDFKFFWLKYHFILTAFCILPVHNLCIQPYSFLILISVM